jgi:hypothetical protein
LIIKHIKDWFEKGFAGVGGDGGYNGNICDVGYLKKCLKREKL